MIKELFLVFFGVLVFIFFSLTVIAVDLGCLDSDGGRFETIAGVGYRLWPPSLLFAEKERIAPDGDVSELVGFRDVCDPEDKRIVREKYCVYTDDSTDNSIAGTLETQKIMCEQGYVCRDDIPFDNPYLDLQVKLWRHYFQRDNESEREDLIEKGKRLFSHAAKCVPQEDAPETLRSEELKEILSNEEFNALLPFERTKFNKYSLAYSGDASPASDTVQQVLPEFSLVAVAGTTLLSLLLLLLVRQHKS